MKRSSKNPPIKLRVIYNDPDATDLSSDEEEKMNHPKSQNKRVIKAISCLSLRNYTAGSKKPRRRESMFHGVRQRPWGKFSSEIKDPFTKKGLWLGTYDTAEEASVVYQAKKREFAEMEMAASKEKNRNTSYSQPSPSSVLEHVLSNPTEDKANDSEKAMKEWGEDEESIKDLWKDEPSIMDLLEAPQLSASESMGELSRPYGHEDYLSSNAVNCHWLLPTNSDGNLIDLFDIKMNLNNDLAWVDEILNLQRN